MRIGDKVFMNIQEAVGWLLANNALPFQCKVSYVADTEIAKSNIINPSPAEIRVGAMVLFNDGKMGTVSGITSSGFMVGSEYVDLIAGTKYIVSATVDSSGNLSFTLSDGTVITAGQIKQIDSFSVNNNEELIAYFNDGSSVNCGALISGDLNLPANLGVAGNLGVVGTVHIEDKVTMDDDLDVLGEAYFDNPVRVADSLTVDNNANIGGDLSVSGDASIAGELSLAQGSAISSNTNSIMIYDANGDIQLNGDVALSSGKVLKAFENIVDKDGHKRFIEGNVILSSSAPAGVTLTYGKWSLSGTHLMIVVGLSLADTTAISSGVQLAQFDLPSWVGDQIVPIFDVSVVDRRNAQAWADNYTNQDFGVYLLKSSSTAFRISKSGAITLTANRNVRIAFDLLIDNA